jgi:hypothetical protein
MPKPEINRTCVICERIVPEDELCMCMLCGSKVCDECECVEPKSEYFKWFQPLSYYCCVARAVISQQENEIETLGGKRYFEVGVGLTLGSEKCAV